MITSSQGDLASRTPPPHSPLPGEPVFPGLAAGGVLTLSLPIATIPAKTCFFPPFPAHTHTQTGPGRAGQDRAQGEGTPYFGPTRHGSLLSLSLLSLSLPSSLSSFLPPSPPPRLPSRAAARGTPLWALCVCMCVCDFFGLGCVFFGCVFFGALAGVEST